MHVRTPLLTALLLALALPGASADHAEGLAALSADCHFTTGAALNSNEVQAVLAGVATAPGAVETRVACELLDSLGNPVAALEATHPGSAAAGATAATMAFDALTVCTSASAVYPDGSTVALLRECVTP